MRWWLHTLIYVLGSFALFFALGFLIVLQGNDLIPFAIFILPVPVVIFHLIWKRVKVSCVKSGCDGSMVMSSAGSVYYTCARCGEIKNTLIKRNPQDRGTI